MAVGIEVSVDYRRKALHATVPIHVRPALGFVLHVPRGLDIQHLTTGAIQTITESVHRDDGNLGDPQIWQ